MYVLEMVRRALLASGTLGLLAAVVLALAPVDGVSGNALSPASSDFGWFAYEPLPDRPTVDDLRRAGVPVPQDAVADRRVLVGTIGGAGLLALAAGVLLTRVQRR